MVQVNVQVERMMSESTTSQKVYTDDPQSAGSALVKGGDNGGFWDDDWNE